LRLFAEGKRLSAVVRLPLVAKQQRALETCVYCPKLCRAACPVSNAEASETVTPWGKMSLAYFASRGDIPINAVHAAPAWACTSCHACRERCDHRNEPAKVLEDARADLFEAGAAPAAAVNVARRSNERWADAAKAIDEIEKDKPRGQTAVAGVLVGCGYTRRAKEIARDALSAAERLVGGPVRAIRGCCGLPELYAGDRTGLRRAAQRLAAETAGLKRLIVVDPGCARALLVEHARVGEPPERKPELFLDLVFASIDRLRPLSYLADRPVRFHDPCQLGRGLGRYDEPRAILARILGGQPPQRFQREREYAECSGGGGLLPVTRSSTSAAIADARIAEHHAAGGGLLVTACEGSLRRFRSRGEDAEDLVTLIARSLGGAG
jgi:dimethylglycine catabolism B